MSSVESTLAIKAVQTVRGDPYLIWSKQVSLDLKHPNVLLQFLPTACHSAALECRHPWGEQ